MAQPQAYNRQTSFTNFQSANPTLPPDGGAMDAEFNAVKTTSDQIINNIALIQRDDGRLRTASVTRDQLAPDVPVGFNRPEPWTPNRAYTTNDTVFFNSQFFGCITSHTSTSVFDSTKWRLIADFSTIAIAAAGNVSFTPTGGIVSSNVQAALAEVDAKKALLVHTHTSSDISDSTSAGRSVLTAASVAAIQTLLGISSFKPGDLKPTSAVVPEAGYVWADGASYLISSFPALYAATTINTTGNTTNGSNIVSNIPDTNSMRAGMPVNGTNISGFAVTILAVDSPTQIRLTANATGTTTSGTLVVAPNGMADATHFYVVDYRGRALVGRDDGNNNPVPAGRITAACGVIGTRLGNGGGAEVVTLTTATIPVVTPTGAVGISDPGHTHTLGSIPTASQNLTATGIPSFSTNVATVTTSSSTTGITASFTGNAFGSGGAHQNMPPFLICNVLIKT